jgi:hypothetical protein
MTKHGRLDVMRTFSFEGTDEELGDYSDIAGHVVSETSTASHAGSAGTRTCWR